MCDNYQSGGAHQKYEIGAACQVDRGPGCKCSNISLLDEMCKSIGRVVIVYTASGGLSGSGFVGLLIAADCNYVKLVTNVPTGPQSPFGSCDHCQRRSSCFNMSRYGQNQFGTVMIIPTGQIVSFAKAEV